MVGYIRFDLQEYDGLSVKDFEVLLNKAINSSILVNGYALEWEYSISDDGVIFLYCFLRNTKGV